MTEIQRIAVMTSGGDCPGKNAAVRAVVRTGINKGLRIFGIRKGYEGLINGDISELFNQSVAEIVNRGGTFLGTARSKEFHTTEGQDKAIEQLRYQSIDALVVIGGNGSLSGAHVLAEKGVKVIGVPGTIDNDLWGTNTTIGFDTALNTIVEALDKLRDTASAHNRIFIVETMGKGAGWLALKAAIAGGADVVIIPEVEWKIENVVNELMKRQALNKSFSIVVVAEGAIHASDLKIKLEPLMNVNNIRISVLGYIQRGGSPSAYDRILGSSLGAAAIDYLLKGKSDIMVCMKDEKIISVPLIDVFTKTRPINLDMLMVANMIV